MSTVSTERRLLPLPVIMLAVLSLGCREDTFEIPIAPTCTDLVTVTALGPNILRPYVIPAGGSQRMSVQLRKPHRNHYSYCPEMSLEQLRWTIDDPDVARVEYDAPLVTITGLAVGSTWMSLHYGTEVLPWRLTIVEP